jgi:hypothetical protein
VQKLWLGTGLLVTATVVACAHAPVETGAAPSPTPAAALSPTSVVAVNPYGAWEALLYAPASALTTPATDPYGPWAALLYAPATQTPSR